jgi:hypothetical protein
MSVADYNAAKKALVDFDRFVRLTAADRQAIIHLQLSWRQDGYNSEQHAALAHVATEMVRSQMVAIIAAHRSALVQRIRATRKTALAELAAMLIEEPPE